MSVEQYRKAIGAGRPAAKYKAVATTVDGIRFQSRKEANYYCDLKRMRAAGVLKFFLRQVPFDLPGDPTPVKYVCDFVEFYANGEIKFVDVKGVRTRAFIDKQKMVRALYGVAIQEA